MITSIQVKKNTNENNMGLLRRFSRRVQETNVLRIVKGKRYSERVTSKLAQKKIALKKIARVKVNMRLKKLGKIA